MASFDTATATPSAVSELVAATAATKDNNSLQGPIVASIDSGSVQAYAKLEGEELCYYMRTLQVSLGRKVSNPNNVDIPLGNTKSVSRQHARLFYNFSSQRFELTVFGKNGAFVNERFVERGVTVPLENKTKIQIGEIAFVFLLPKKQSDNGVNKVSNTPKHNIEDFGYISTPHQLEKVITNIQTADNSGPGPVTSPHDDYNRDDGSVHDDNDHNSETSEATNPYNNKDIKPPYSYASLIAQAINSSNDKRMTLNGIYNYITTNYPYYQMAQNGWQNSIRHNLSLNKAFVKVPRGDTEPGKGAFWTIDSNAETQFTNGVYKRNKRAGVSPSSHTTSGHHYNHYQQSQSQKPDTVDSIRKKLKKEHQNRSEDQIQEPEDDEEDEVEPTDIEITTKTESASVVSLNTLKEPNESVLSDSGLSTMVSPILEKEDTTIASEASFLLPPLPPQSITVTTVSVKNEIPKQLTETSKAIATSSQQQQQQQQEQQQQQQQQQQQEVQAQLQLQLQNTIRQHLLDPVRYPLPPSIAQLLPQAIAQLPPQLAAQLSSTLQKVKFEDNSTISRENAAAASSFSASSSPSEINVNNLEVSKSTLQ